MKKIRHKLSTAGYALLGITAPALSDGNPWLVDLGIMNFIEQDRNTGLELILRGSHAKQEGGFINIIAELDVITGATPNGATSSNVPQSFTMSSGVGSYSVKRNELPADDTHMDTRIAIKTEINDPLNTNLSADYNALISMEFDYLAFAMGSVLSWDLNKNNTTLISGVNLEYNRVHPVGNTALPLEIMQPPGQSQPRGVAARTKQGEEFSLGLNQIIDRSSLAQIRLTTSHFSGYLNDSYKILSIIDNEDPINLGQTLNYIFENRPTSRRMKSLYLAYKKSWQPGVLDVSYRRYDDSWDVRSDTVDIAFKFKLENRYFLRPHLRFYQQDGAFFYRHSLQNGERLPEFASAELRLASFDATTVGIEIGKDLANGRKHSLTIEYYTQQGDRHPADAIGLQKQQDLYPTLRTLVLKYVLAFKS